MELEQIRKERQKVNKKSGKLGSRFADKTALALEVDRLTLEGRSAREIAKIIDRTERYVRELRAYAREEKAGWHADKPEPRNVDNLPDEFRVMVQPYHDFRAGEGSVEDVVEGFTAFFDRFSGRILPEHTKEWVAAAFSNRRVLLNVPPRHAKSTVMSVWLPMYLVCADRNTQALIVSQTQDFAIKFCREIAEHFENDAEMIRAFGVFVPSNQSWTWAPNAGTLMVEGRTRLIKSGDMTIQIKGAQQQILGTEADWILCDDPDSPDIVVSETQRKRLLDWFNDQVITRLNPGGHAVVVGQRLALNDLYGSLAKKKYTRKAGSPPLFNHINYPAVLDWDTKEVLWEEEWSFDRLMDERYEDLGRARFECMYQQNPMPAGQRLVQENWIQGDDTHAGCLDRERIIGKGWYYSEQLFPVVRVLSADPSPTRNAGIIVADALYDPSAFHLAIIHSEGKPYQARDFLQRLDQLMTMYAPVDYLVVEDSAVSKWIFQDPWWQQKKSQVRLLKHSTHAHNKGDPTYGVQGLAIEFEFGQIKFPYGDAESRDMTDKFLDELYTWPEGEYDDQLMALWFIKYVSKSLLPFRQMMGKMDTRGTAFAGSDNGAWDF